MRWYVVIMSFHSLLLAAVHLDEDGLTSPYVALDGATWITSLGTFFSHEALCIVVSASHAGGSELAAMGKRVPFELHFGSVMVNGELVSKLGYYNLGNGNAERPALGGRYSPV